MRIVFIGTVEFSKKALEKLIELNSNIVGVCTKEYSNLNSDFSDLTPLCIQKKIPYKLIDDINSFKNIQWISELKPDIIFCFGWSYLIKKELLNLTRMGIVGFHPTELPFNRGRHPLIWALALGLKQSASTFFFMDEGADSGDILSQKPFNILYEDNAKSLYNKVTKLALSQIEEFLPELENETYLKKKQNHNLSNTWRKRGITDGLIDFRMSSYAIYNLVRALTKPYVGAHVVYKNKNISIWKIKEVDFKDNNFEPGKILNISNNIITVKTYDGAVNLLEHEFQTLPEIGEYL